MEDTSYFFQSSWASFCPGARLAESTDQYSFIISLVEGFLVTIVSSECGWGNFDDCLGEEREEVSFMKSFFEMLYVLFFSWRFSFFPEATLKRLPTATEAEVKQVISAQLKYAPDRAHGGGRGKDGRVTQRSWNGSGTANPQLLENCYCIYLGLSDKTTYNFFMERSFHSSQMIHVEKMRINWVISFFCNLLLFNKHLRTFA